MIDAALMHAGHGGALRVAAFVAGSSFVENVMPPYPGDLAVTLGAAVAVSRHWSLPGVYACAVGGGLAGATCAWAFGRWLSGPARRVHRPWVERAVRGVDEASAALDRYGVAALVIGRFVPVGRAFVVVAAGFHRMALPKVMACALLGGVLWDGLLFGVAIVLGHNLHRVSAWLAMYDRVVGAVFVVALVVWAARKWWRGRSSVTS